MKKIVLAISVIASAFLLASCANKGTDQTTAVSSDTTSKAAAPAKKRHHHDYKAEAASK